MDSLMHFTESRDIDEAQNCEIAIYDQSTRLISCDLTPVNVPSRSWVQRGMHITHGREGSMELALSRAGLWLVALLIAVAACAAAVDTGFAIHMGIVALACIIGLVVTLRGVDLSKAIMAPDQGRYDDDVIRWGVIATVFWG
ncbi:MAG: hypothetical protein ACOVKV_04910, partial [Novosphingobium sp.]